VKKIRQKYQSIALANRNFGVFRFLILCFWNSSCKYLSVQRYSNTCII